MKWIAIVPVNYGRDCKTRLATRLDRAHRTALVEVMARHVIAQLQSTASIEDIRVLSPVRPPFAPSGWIEDMGRGLNAELDAARAVFPHAPIAFVHADLPFLGADDVRALLDRARMSGATIAPDRREQGTNAVAIADGRQFMPAFGPDSFLRHKNLLPDAAIVRTEGLSFDLDEEADLDLAMARGLFVK
jgi:2-phospho-L-lactate guanylyltransferase